MKTATLDLLDKKLRQRQRKAMAWTSADRARAHAAIHERAALLAVLAYIAGGEVGDSPRAIMALARDAIKAATCASGCRITSPRATKKTRCYCFRFVVSGNVRTAP